MFGAISIILITLLTVAHFYLKSPILKSFATTIAAVLGLIIAFSYYEPLANMLISRGRGGQWAQGCCFFLLFVLSFAIIRMGSDYVVGANISFGEVSTKIVGVISGTITGMIISGVFVITVTMLPVRATIPYARFGEEINVNEPDKLGLNADGFAAGFFGWISKGSLSCDKSFDALHPDYVNGLHLNRVKPIEPKQAPRFSKKADPVKILTIAASDCIVLPKKYSVRIKDVDDHSRTFVRVGIKSSEIAKGGAANKERTVSFALSQVRLICKAKGALNEMSGNSTVVYPDRYLIAGKRPIKDPGLGKVVSFSGKEFKRGKAWIDLAFNVPSGMQGAFLVFKNNTIVELPKPVESSGAVERELEAEIRGESKEK